MADIKIYFRCPHSFKLAKGFGGFHPQVNKDVIVIIFETKGIN